MGFAMELDHVSYRYEDGTFAMLDVSLSLRAGEKIALLGENGSGKSTLFHLLTGLLKPTNGTIHFCSEPLTYRAKSLRSLREAVGLVFQDPDVQLFSASVEQEVAFGALNLGFSMDEARARTAQAMEQTGVSDLIDRPTHFLSYGQKKRVSIADVLVMNPQCLLLDEPTAWLDPCNAIRVSELLSLLNAQGRCIVCSTHDVDWAYGWAQRVIILKKGSVLYDGAVVTALTDRLLMEEAGLTLPKLAVISDVLRQNKLIDGYPRTVDELTLQLKNKI